LWGPLKIKIKYIYQKRKKRKKKHTQLVQLVKGIFLRGKNNKFFLKKTATVAIFSGKKKSHVAILSQ
jgi:hypothetical protein